MHRQAIALLFFSLLLPLSSLAQVQAAQVYGADELGSTHVYAITQGALGEMWFLTQQGIAVYDGATWKRHPGSIGLPNTRLSQLFACPDSSIWVFGHRDNTWMIRQYKEGHWTDFPSPPGWDTNPDVRFTVAVKCTRSGPEILLAQSGRYFHFLDGWKAYHLDTNDTIRQVAFHGASLVFLTKDALYSRQQSQVEKLLGGVVFPEGPLNNFLFSAQSDTIFLKGNNWLGLYAQNSFKLLYQSTDAVHLSYLKGSLSRFGDRLFFNLSGSPYAMHLASGKTFPIRTQEGSLQNRTNQLFVDRQQNIWAASERGVFKFNSLRFTNYTGSVASEFEVASIAAWGENHLLIGHNYGFSILQDGKITRYPLPGLGNEGPVSRALDAVIGADGLGYLAFEGFGVVRVFPTGKWERLYEGNAVSLLGFDDRLVFSTNYEGMGWLHYKTGRVQFNKGLLGYFRKMYPYGDRQILLLSSYGLLKTDEGLTKLENVYRGGGGLSLNIFNRLVLPDGRQVFGTMAGLQQWDGNGFSPAKIHGQTIDRPVYALHTDPQGKIWVGMDFGVAILEEGRPVRLLHARDGLAGNEVNRSALVSTANGKVYIGTDKGLSIYDASMDLPTQSPPIPRVYEVLTSQDKYVPTEAIKVPYGQMLELHFGAASFYDESSVLYRFRLEGLEEDWRYLSQGPDNHVRYSRLPSGHYKFELQAKEVHSPWSQTTVVEDIYVRKPFYLAPWFIIVAILLLVGIGSVIQLLFTFKSNEYRLKRTIADKIATIESKEKELKRQNMELTKANRELDSFIHSVSHDLKSPLSSMRGLLELAKAEQSIEEKNTYLGLADTSLTRLESFIQDIIDLSRNARLEVTCQPIDLAALVNEIFEGHRHNDPSGSLDLQLLAQSNQVVHTDEKRLRIILNNLISNAVKYRNQYIGNPYVKVTFSMVAEKAVIEVADNGIGIEKAKIARIFDIFFRATDQQKGSGLGLYILKETLEKLGGSIQVASTPNKGSTFTITLPNQKPQGPTALPGNA
jgi:signal transduction histidine kinase